MVGHQTECEETDIDPFAGFLEELVEGREVAGLAEDGAAHQMAQEDRAPRLRRVGGGAFSGMPTKLNCNRPDQLGRP